MLKNISLTNSYLTLPLSIDITNNVINIYKTPVNTT